MMRKLAVWNPTKLGIDERFRSIADVALLILMVLLALPVCLLWVWPKWYLQGVYDRFQRNRSRKAG